MGLHCSLVWENAWGKKIMVWKLWRKIGLLLSGWNVASILTFHSLYMLKVGGVEYIVARLLQRIKLRDLFWLISCTAAENQGR